MEFFFDRKKTVAVTRGQKDSMKLYQKGTVYH